MSYEDRISIATPEGVDLDVTLAGVGSRFVATLVDQAIQWAVLLALLFVAGPGLGDAFVDEGAESEDIALVLAALVLVIVFVMQVGYHIVFETLAGGRTPGKRWTGLRVLKAGGTPVTFTASTIRNLVRVVDALPGAYLVGLIAILATERNQRLGDLAAGTIVVRERKGSRPRTLPEMRHEASAEAMTWDVSAVTADELVAVRRFLERRASLTNEARARLARELATRLTPKVVGPDEDMAPEDFLAELAAAKAARG